MSLPVVRSLHNRTDSNHPPPMTALDDAIGQAAAHLQAGGLVGMPTETVYGLAADARNAQAVLQVFAAKQRPSFDPLIVHVADQQQAETVAKFSEQARTLAQACWPGPLTMVLPRQPRHS